MASVKMTFSLDEGTAAELARAAERLDRPKSAVVRDAIRDYAERIGRLSERERLEMLRIFDQVVPTIPRRAAAEVERELAELRQARRAGGRGGAAAR